MRGTKRSAISEPSPAFDANNSFMQSKRVMGSHLDAQRVEPSIQMSQPLDMKRAESSRQHVRALNSQFASWIQTQLQRHPDELWEDGVQDYLNHSKGIMEKFSDVVNWLKGNALNGSEMVGHNMHPSDTQTKPTSEADKHNHKLLLEKSSFPPPGALKFGTSWSPGTLLHNNGPFNFGGTQISVPSNSNPLPSNDKISNEEDVDVEQPSSPSVKKSEEKGVHVVHEVKCKLYEKSISPEDKGAWKDKGMGQLSIKCKEGIEKGNKESKPTIVIRNEVGKVLLNALLYPGIKTNVQKNSVVAIFHTSADEINDSAVARTFLMRTKTTEDGDKLASVIQEYAPAA